MEIDSGVTTPIRKECGMLMLLNASTQIEQPEQYNILPEKIFINKDLFVIGRETHTKVDASLDSIKRERMISRKHCKIERRRKLDTDAEFFVMDLQSTNGTYLFNQKISVSTPQPLQDGDLIVFVGSETFPDDTLAQMSNKIEMKTYILSNFSEKCLIFEFRIISKEVLLQESTIYFEKLKPYLKHIPNLEQQVEEQSLKRDRNTYIVATNGDANELDSKKLKLEHQQTPLTANSVGFNSTQEINLSEKEKALQEKEKELNEREKHIKTQEEATRKERLKALLSLPPDIEEEFTCVICQDIILDATTMQCSHTFCRSCIFEWLKDKRSCPSCRKPMTRKPMKNITLENIIEKLISKLPEDARQARQARIEDQKKKDDELISQLKKNIDLAKKNGSTFLSIKNVWSQSDKEIFLKGLKQYKNGAARAIYCNLIGLNNEYIDNANETILVKVCQNLNLEVVQLVHTVKRTSIFDPEGTKDRLRDFIDGEL